MDSVVPGQQQHNGPTLSLENDQKMELVFDQGSVCWAGSDIGENIRELLALHIRLAQDREVHADHYANLSIYSKCTGPAQSQANLRVNPFQSL